MSTPDVMKSHDFGEDFGNPLKSSVIRELDKIAEKGGKLITDLEPATMKESDFVGFFLPRFLGEIVDEQNDWLSIWSTITDQLTKEVAVLDDDTGEVIYHMPNILSRKSHGVDKSKQTMGHVILEYQMKRNNHPMVAMNYLYRELGRRTNIALNGIDRTEDLERWRAIVALYRHGPNDPKGRLDPPRGENVVVTTNEAGEKVVEEKEEAVDYGSFLDL